ncbi:hypothetical protein KY284_010187 [Solanum tuberosum]|nr:hypothetical protein KY284_010187 [Solanum tuberosum]
MEELLNIPRNVDPPIPLPILIEERLTNTNNTFQLEYATSYAYTPTEQLCEILDMQTPNLEDEETMGYEEDEDMEDHVVPQMQEGGLSSLIQHQATQELREEVLNILDPFTQTLHLKEHLTLEMQKYIERKYIIIIPHQVKKASINIRYHNLSNKMTYMILAIPSSQNNLGATMVNMKDNHPVNLDMTLILGGSSSTQENPLMKILLWNCRSAHNASFMTNLRVLVELNKPIILALT